MVTIEYKDYSKEKLSPEQFRKLLKDSCVVKNIPITELVYLEKNANVMDEKVFSRLEENLSHDGIVTQPPFVQKLPNGKYEIISGNHRVKGAKKAGHTEVLCLACEVTLPEDEKLRIQISHNTIRGEHNALILKEILSEIKDMDAIRLSGADFDMSMLKMEKMDFKSIDANALDIRQIVIYFTNRDVRSLDRLISDIDQHLTGKSKVYLAEHKLFKTFVEEIVNIKNEANIISSGMALSLIIEYAGEHLNDIFNYYLNKYGTDKVQGKTKVAEG